VKRYIFVICIILGSYSFLHSSGKYSVAEDFLENQDYEKSAAEYSKIILESGGVDNSRDIKALTGGFISNYMLQDYKTSFAMAKRVLKIDSYNSCAIFYAGQNLEALGKTELAQNIFKYYEVLPENAPYKRFSEIKFHMNTQFEVIEKIESAIEREERMTYTPPIPNLITILYTINDGYDVKWDYVGKGMTDLLIRDMQPIKSFEVVGRREVEILLNKLELGPSQLLDANVVKKIGSILRSRYVIGGSYNVNEGLNSIFNIFIYDMLDQSNLQEYQFTYNDQNFGKIEKDILKKILMQLGVEVDSDMKKVFKNVYTENYEAFTAYGKGLDLFDIKNFDESLTYFSQAIELDPQFELAYERQAFVDAMNMILHNTFAYNHFEINKKRQQFLAIFRKASIPLLQERIRTMSGNLDLGYIPGNDSRAGKEAYIIPEIPEIRKLGSPPKPPGN